MPLLLTRTATAPPSGTAPPPQQNRRLDFRLVVVLSLFLVTLLTLSDFQRNVLAVFPATSSTAHTPTTASSRRSSSSSSNSSSTLRVATTNKPSSSNNNKNNDTERKEESTVSQSVLLPVVPATKTTQQQLELVHIPKTGGTAIEYAASLANITWGLCHWQARPLAGPGCQSPNWLHYNAAKTNLDYSKVENSWEIWHTPPRWLHTNSPYRNKTLFAVVRNPYERFISEFYCPYNGLNPVDWTVQDDREGVVDPMGKPVEKALQEANDKAAKTGPNHGRSRKPETPKQLNKFLMERLQYFAKWTAHYLPQSDFIYDEQGNQLVDHVLKFERLGEEFSSLMEQYQLPVFLNSTINQHSSISKFPTRLTVNDLYPETIKRINQVVGKDFVNFGYKRIHPQTLAKQRNITNTIQRIYYINLQKNTERRAQMESWLNRQPIPFARINATIGSSNPQDCVAGKQAFKRCRGLSGLVMTELDIIHNHNVSGLTLIFEDDFVATKPLQEVVDRTLELVPSDWDVIRWDCWGEIPNSFDFIVPRKVFRTVHQRPCTSDVCWYSGGTHAMMWKEESVSKLHDLWSEKPYDDIDVRLTRAADKLVSYCVQLKIGKLMQPDGEVTDIDKD